LAKSLTFITGIEGTGTTLLLAWLGTPSQCSAIGGNHFDLPDRPAAMELADQFGSATAALWDGERSDASDGAALAKAADCWRALLASEAFASIDHFIYKRSTPFSRPRDRFRPKLADVLLLEPSARIVVMHRDPRAAAYSSFRRFGGTLEEVARSVACNLEYLDSQIAALSSSQVRIVPYHRLCTDPSCYRDIISFCGLPPAPTPALEHATDERYRDELSANELDWLDRYFEGPISAHWRRLDGEMPQC
jgi:hypothetical protein